MFNHLEDGFFLLAISSQYVKICILCSVRDISIKIDVPANQIKYKRVLNDEDCTYSWSAPTVH